MRHIRFVLFLSLVLLLGSATFLFFVPANYVEDKHFAGIEVAGKNLMVEVAADPASRAKGLSARSALNTDGMVFLFDAPGFYQFWMKDMNFPIDIIWIRRGVVVDFEERVPFWPKSTPDFLLPRYQPDVPADTVLEVKSGFIAQNNVRIGDRIKFFPESVSNFPEIKSDNQIFDDTASSSSEINTDSESRSRSSDTNSAVLLKVNFFTQAPYDNWDFTHEGACEEAAIIMADNFFLKKNVSLSEYDHLLMQLVKTGEKKFGHGQDINAEDIAVLANYFAPALEARKERISSLAEIKKEIDSGLPVIAPVEGRLLGNPHYGPSIDYHAVLVIGYNSEEIIVNDPGTKFGGGWRYQNETFWKAISDLGTKEKAVVIFRPVK
jgi:uncharacterized membrane protein (UPF0127 family)